MSPPIHPLTSSQGAVFLVNSCQGNFRCGPTCVGQALFRRYGRFFAEFLGAHSLVRLALLELYTCVGCGTVVTCISLEVFLGRLFINVLLAEARSAPLSRYCVVRIFLHYISASTDANPIRRVDLFPPSLHHLYAGQGILTLCPSGAAFAIPLGPTNPTVDHH